MELIEDDRFANGRRNSYDWASTAVHLADRLHLLAPLKVAGGLAGRKVVIT
jgi:hypothetical protein